jgi:transmembrane sensor
MNQPASYFQSKASEARVARVWSCVDARLERAGTRQRLRWMALGLSLAAALVLVAYAGARWHRPAATAQILELADGSRVEYGAADRLEVAAVTPERVELRMIQGRALFRVAPNPDRAFLTHIAGYTLRVIGTEYSVDLGGGGVRVEVTRGEVEVRRDDGADAWRVRAGEVWSSAAAADALPAAPPPAPMTSSVPPSNLAPSVPTSKRAAPVPAQPAQPVAADAAALFQRAQDARAAGRTDEAARLLSEFLQRYPNDARAGLAAFELGRIRLDTGDPKGAVEALDQAEGAGNAFAEQVEARRVQALEQSGDVAACRAARASFLRRFPNGSFSSVVRRRCP